jgi:hypothetical protein
VYLQQIDIQPRNSKANFKELFVVHVFENNLSKKSATIQLSDDLYTNAVPMYLLARVVSIDS